MTLLARDEHTQRALAWFGRAFDADRLDPATLIWLRQQARRGWGEVLGARIARAVAEGCTDDVDLARCSSELAFAPECVPGAADALVDLAAGEGIHAPEATKLLHDASQGPWRDTLDDHVFHASWMGPADDPELEAALQRHYERVIARRVRAGNLDPELIAELAVRIPRYPAIASALEPGLLELLDRDPENRLGILRLLGHLRCGDTRARDAWLETARGWRDYGKDMLKHFPCPPTRDDEVLDVLLDVLRRAEHVYQLEEELRFVGLTDADSSLHVRWLLDHLPSEPSIWAWLVSSGFRGFVDEPLSLPQELASDSADREITKARALRMNRLALNCATRKDRGEDIAADEEAIVELLELEYHGGAGGYDDYVQWGFWHAQTLGLDSDRLIRTALRYARIQFLEGWYVDRDAARAYLESTALPIEHQVGLQRDHRYQEPVLGPHGINIVNPRYDGRSMGKVAIERTPQMRRALYQGNIWALDELSRCTRLVGRDLDYLEAVLARGRAGMRVWALELVERERIDGARVREAVHKRLHDVDGEVRHRARTVTETMGW